MFFWFLLLVVYLPFQIALNPSPNFDLASIRVLITIFFCFWVCLNFFSKKFRLTFNLTTAGTLLFLLIAGLSVFLAQNHQWALRKFLFFGTIFPVYFLTIAAVKQRTQLKKIISVIFYSSSLIALIGLIQFLAQFYFKLDAVIKFWAEHIVFLFSGANLGKMILTYPSWLVDVGQAVWLRAFSIYSDPHMLAFYLGLAMPLGFSLLCISRTLRDKIVISAILFLDWLGLLMTFTRGAYLALIVSCLTLAVFYWWLRKKFLIPGLLILSLGILVIPGNPFSYRFLTAFNLQEESNLGRLEMWQQATYLAQRHFFTGIGLGSYSLEVEPNLGYRNPATAHNLYLDIFSEMGIIALALWLILIVGAGWINFKALIINKEKSSLIYFRLGLLGAIIYYLSHSFFETAIYQPVIMSLIFIILGLTYVTEKINSSVDAD